MPGDEMKTKSRTAAVQTICNSDIIQGLIDDATTAENALQPITDDLTAIDEKTIRNEIKTALENYSIENDVDISGIKQIQWNAVLEYLYDNVIKGYNIDYRDILSLDTLCNVYMSICRNNQKSSSIYGFTLFIHVPYNTLKNNKYKDSNNTMVYIDITSNRVLDEHTREYYKRLYNTHNIIIVSNNIYRAICKKIQDDREHALTDKVEDGSVMSLALGKIENGWIESAKEKIQVEMLENYRLPSDLINKYSDN